MKIRGCSHYIIVIYLSPFTLHYDHHDEIFTTVQLSNQEKDNILIYICMFCVFHCQYVCCQYYQWRYLVTTYRSPLVWRVRSRVFRTQRQTFNSDYFTILEHWHGTGLDWSVTICVIMNGPLEPESEPEQSTIWAWCRLAVWLRNPRHKVSLELEHPGRLQRETDIL